MNKKFFIDFDGTITRNDVIDLILEKFAAPEWKNVEKDWLEGRIGSRVCLEKQMALVEATKEAFKELVHQVEIDPAFVPFLKKARQQSVPVTIVSDGLDWVIRGVLKRNFEKNPELVSDLPIYSNRLVIEPRATTRVAPTNGFRVGAGFMPARKNAFRVVFPTGPICQHGCANCKERIIKNLSKPEDFIVFVGDGLSDRYAARAAHLTFAKNKLLAFCEENKIEHKPYTSFQDISKWLLSGKVTYAAV